MPYDKGRRVSNEEWSKLHGSTAELHTSERGENPGEEGVVLFDANKPDGGLSEDSGDKVVVGTEVLDVPDIEADEADVSVASGDLTGDIPGEGSGESRESADDAAEDEADKVPDTAPEAAADFVAKSKAKRKARGA